MERGKRDFTKEEKEERDKVARAIRALRKQEQEKGLDTYVMDRSGEAYENILCGFSATFDYLKKLPSQVVLDIGAGTTRAIYDISEKYFAGGLDFRATALTRGVLPELESDSDRNFDTHASIYIGEDRCAITSVEVLRGVEDNSVACILSVHSVGYSVSPKMAIESINRVLVPGGVVKMFMSIDGPDNQKGSPAREFVRELKNFGYELSFFETRRDEHHVTIAGVKPGGPSVDVGELFEKDAQGYFGYAESVVLFKDDDELRLVDSIKNSK